MGLSMLDQLAQLPPDEARQVIARLTDAEADALMASWHFHARPEQLPPPGYWIVWLILAGRGFGKTRSGAEWSAEKTRLIPGSRGAVIAPTWADMRDTCMEGESGLLAALDPSEIRDWNRSLGQLRLMNGSRIQGFGADAPNRLRGPQHHWVWADEVASWRRPETWDMMEFGLRLGDHPQACATTTPKPVKLIRALVADPGVVHTGGSTYDNAANLATSFRSRIMERYEGTRLGRQELYAELLSDTPGALWTMTGLDACRVDAPPLPPSSIVVAVDPAVTATESSDETGIIVVGSTFDGHAYVLEDLSGHYTMEGWGRVAADAFHRFGADEIVAEKNNGGDLVALAIKAADPTIPVQLVTAVKSKYARAEPVAQKYEQKLVHHVHNLATLESEMTTWTKEVEWSPNRMDALVWGVTRLLLEQSPYLRFEED